VTFSSIRNNADEEQQAEQEPPEQAPSRSLGHRVVAGGDVITAFPVSRGHRDGVRLDDEVGGQPPCLFGGHGRHHHPERTRLTAERAAAVLSVLTDGKHVSVINARAGSGGGPPADRPG
jgi:hypothetical protein